MLSALIIGAIALSVAIGYKTKFNTGFFAIVFAYLIGCFALGMKTKDVIGGWPVSTMFVIFSVSLFYNFALVNGTLEKTARYLLYACRRFPGLLPFALYLASAGIAALGAGFFTVMAFMAPITILICKEARMDQLTGAVAINCGALSGANFMTSGSGIIFRGLMEEGGLGDVAFSYTAVIFVGSVLFSLLLIGAFRYIPKSNRGIGKGVTFERPEAFTDKQRINLYLMIAMIIVVLIFPILHIILPGAEAITFINSKMDVGLVAVLFSVIAMFFGLASQKDVIAKVPWNTIIMICSVGMLINVAIEAGTIDLLAAWAGSSLPTWIVPIAFSIIGAIMSFFSSTLGVVCPALFPLVPTLAGTTGINPLTLFACIIIGAQSSAISPFSSGGSLVLGSCSTEEERNEMFPKLLFVAVPVSVLSSVAFNLILSFVL
ncbi:SLC13 family permease [bacterium D16-54]|nr:SLC13 family permease [bacterium D16-54]RKJ14669.1 SLC13 family permease [bacterium D16-56]